jgi:hypothetical protein
VLEPSVRASASVSLGPELTGDPRGSPAGGGVRLGTPTVVALHVFLCPPECITLSQHKNRVEEAENPVPVDGCLKGRAEPVAQPATGVIRWPVSLWGKGRKEVEPLEQLTGEKFRSAQAIRANNAKGGTAT